MFSSVQFDFFLKQYPVERLADEYFLKEVPQVSEIIQLRTANFAVIIHKEFSFVLQDALP